MRPGRQVLIVDHRRGSRPIVRWGGSATMDSTNDLLQLAGVSATWSQRRGGFVVRRDDLPDLRAAADLRHAVLTELDPL